MFEIFKALFGVGYYTGKIAKEQARERAYELNHSAEQEIRSALTDAVYEREILSKWNDKNYRTEIATELKSDLEDIYGDNWQDIFNKGFYSSYIGDFYKPEEIILNLLLSRRGCIPQCVRSYKCDGDWQTLSCKVRALKIIENNIRAKHPYLKLYYAPAPIYSTQRIVGYQERFCRGEIIWSCFTHSQYRYIDSWYEYAHSKLNSSEYKESRGRFLEKEENKRRENEASQYCEKYTVPMNDVVISDIESYINDAANFETICRTYSDDLKFIFGTNWEKSLKNQRFFIPKYYWGKSDEIIKVENAVRKLILADRGKIQLPDFVLGVKLNIAINNSDKIKIDETIRLTQCVEKRLNDAGCDIKFIFVPYGFGFATSDNSKSRHGVIMPEIKVPNSQQKFRLW